MDIRTRVPGMITEVLVEEGQHVDAGTKVVTIEAMKMDQGILSPVAGTVEEIMVEVDERVKGGAVIMTIEED